MTDLAPPAKAGVRNPRRRTLAKDAVVTRMQEMNLAPTDLAQRLGVSIQLLDDWIEGSDFPRPDKLLRLAMHLRLRYEELVDLSDEDTPVIEFGKRGRTKSKDKNRGDAWGIGMLLRAVVPHLPPRRSDDFGTDEMRTVLVPVLWGAKSRTEMTMRITLREALVCFCFLNLDKVPDGRGTGSVSDKLFGKNAPLAVEYIEGAEQTYQTEFFAALRTMVREGFGDAFVRQVLGMGLIDGKAVHAALSR